MAKIKRLLKQKTFTGEELGKLYIANIAKEFECNRNDKPQVPYIPYEKLFALVKTNIGDKPEDIMAYNARVNLGIWLVNLQPFMNAYEKAIATASGTLRLYLLASIADYEAMRQRSWQALLMEPKIYDAKIKQKKKEILNDKNGVYNVFDIITKWLHREIYLGTETAKEIEKLYSIPAKSDYIKAVYGDSHYKWLYTLSDGRKILDKDLGDIKTDIERREELKYIGPIQEKDKKSCIKLIQLIINKGLSKEEAIEKIIAQELKAGDIIEAQREQVPQEPKDLTQWDVLQRIGDYYVFPSNASEYAAREGKTIGECFLEDFKDLYSIAAQRIKEEYSIDLEAIPPRDIDKPFISIKQLYAMNFCGEKDKLENIELIDYLDIKDIGVSKFFGIAVLKEETSAFFENDENGFIRPIQPRHALTDYTLKAFRDERADSKTIEVAIENMEYAIFILKSVDAALDIIAKTYGIDDIKIFKSNNPYKEQLETLWGFLSQLYFLVAEFKPFNEREREKKEKDLETLKELFKLPIFEEIKVSAKKKRAIKKTVSNILIFTGPNQWQLKRVLTSDN